jgi:hypothetical protein
MLNTIFETPSLWNDEFQIIIIFRFIIALIQHFVVIFDCLQIFDLEFIISFDDKVSCLAITDVNFSPLQDLSCFLAPPNIAGFFFYSNCFLGHFFGIEVPNCHPGFFVFIRAQERWTTLLLASEADYVWNCDCPVALQHTNDTPANNDDRACIIQNKT